MFEWMNRGMMKEERKKEKNNEWDTDESVEWWNGGMIKLCKYVLMWW